MGPHGNRRAPVHALLASGVAELRPDPARPQGWTLLVDGVPQSYVDLADPGHLEFPYEKQLGRVLRSWTAGGVRAHLGGGGMTVPRLLAHTRPAIAQQVVERDPELVTLVSHRIRAGRGPGLAPGRSAREESDRCAAARTHSDPGRDGPQFI